MTSPPTSRALCRKPQPRRSWSPWRKKARSRKRLTVSVQSLFYHLHIKPLLVYRQDGLLCCQSSESRGCPCREAQTTRRRAQEHSRVQHAPRGRYQNRIYRYNECSIPLVCSIMAAYLDLARLKVTPTDAELLTQLEDTATMVRSLHFYVLSTLLNALSVSDTTRRYPSRASTV